MKKLLILLSVLVFGLIAMAKDGPFPIASAVGLWKSENIKGLIVKISTYERTDATVGVLVVVENNDGVRVAVGHAIHRLDDNLLIVPLIDRNGGREVIEMKAVPAKVLHEPVGSGYHLVMSIEKGGHPSDESAVVSVGIKSK